MRRCSDGAVREDFRKARHNWLYQARNSQPLWFALLAFALLFAINMILQAVAAVSIAPFMEGGITDPHALVKGTIIGMLPVAVVTALACYGLASVMGGHARTSTALRWPHLALLGLACRQPGIPHRDVCSDHGDCRRLQRRSCAIHARRKRQISRHGTAGLVKEAMFDLANEPRLYWIAILSVALGAPLAEEFMFRGPLFASLAQTPLGRWGTVLLSQRGMVERACI